MSAPAYDSYKESGVEWLGAIPLNWQTMRLGRLLARAFNGTTTTQVEPSEATVPVTRIETISGGRLNLNKVGHIPQSEAHPNMRLRAGDILFSHINSLSMIGNCAIFLGGEPLYAGMNLLTLRPATDVHAGWLHWVLQSSSMRQIIAAMAKPAINQASIPQSSLLSVATPVPLPAEQAAIAAFLDRETGKVDKLVEAQTRLIELLKEKRQTVISHAVTKGLDPAAPMKDSGVEWLGQVPAHWAVKPIKAVASYNDDVLTEGTPPDHEIDYVEISDVQAGVGIAGSTAYAFSDAPSRARRRVQRGDIIVSTVRTYLRAIAAVTAPTDNMIVSTGFAVIRPRAINSRFIGYALLAEQTINEIIARSVGISYPAINASDLVRIPVSVPSLAEQVAIAAFLDRETGQIDALVNVAEEAIALLRERRAALISAAVTGKIDVRGLAPEQAEAA